MKHIFLTGEKNVGKSKIIKDFIMNTKSYYKFGGFLTYWVNNKLYLIDIYKTKCVVACKKSKTKKLDITYDAFNIFAAKLINESLLCNMTIIDEIGFMENSCKNFTKSIINRLDNYLPLLGVLRQCYDVSIINNIKNHPNVMVINITEKNRDKILKFLLEHFKIC